MTTVAIIGPDGAGKSAVARRVAASLPIPARYLYMGVNLESSDDVLPTTRLVLAVKRARGARPDMTGVDGAADGRGRPASTRRRRSPVARFAHTAKAAARFGAWTAEEWYRQLLAWRAERSGQVVIFDRHFLADYFHTDVRPVPGRSMARRLHGLMLERVFPRPDAFVLLDVPGHVLAERKGEGTADWLERRRHEYRDLRPFARSFHVVDADRPIDEVVDDVLSFVMDAAGGEPAGKDAPTPDPTAKEPRSTETLAAAAGEAPR